MVFGASDVQFSDLCL